MSPAWPREVSERNTRTRKVACPLKLPHPNAAKVFANWLLGRDGQEVFGRSMAVGSRRLDVDTKWLKEFGVIASKDSLTVEQFYRLENDSEEKIYKLREPAAATARRLLGS